MDIEGNVASLSGRCPVVTFTVHGTRVVTRDTTMYSGGSCSHVSVGAFVKVRGYREADRTVTALHVTIQPVRIDDEDDEEAT